MLKWEKLSPDPPLSPPPPEPSGYLHIGHAKAALLNDCFPHELYKGTLLFRYDDTNSTKEKQEYQDSITEDMALLGIKPDKASHTSDHFQTLYEYYVRMIKEGDAYADDTDQTTIRDERMTGKASSRRNRTVDENLAIFEGIIAETETQNCIRAKISVDNPNKAMRDPVIYRCNHTPHHRTGTLWKAYPTYDFACPLVDSLEGVTHTLRTKEFTDRNLQYQWFLDSFNLRKVHVLDFARLNLKRAFLSKRKLAKLVIDIELELHLEGDVNKTEKNITWLSTDGQKLIPAKLVSFDYLLTKDKLEENDSWKDFLAEQTEFRSAAFCDANLAGCMTGDIIQLERKGYFRVNTTVRGWQGGCAI
ncbi:hypothetical protein G7Y89_g4595 [Cudoniella acicularis]|uniref:glutamate--tRNA ligase n=1 Tax=Cudoniella acicularis TaxID=354080 RepID=A0A8H4RQE3_9HELO|nr:hypothetical protein G7Y89_g4595 [Cudoniella acicularis]